MKLCNDPLCTAFGEEEETACYLLARCPARVQDRSFIFRSQLLELDELSEPKPMSLTGLDSTAPYCILFVFTQESDFLFKL